VRLRIAAIAFLLAVLATGITWLSFQPVMFRLVEALRNQHVDFEELIFPDEIHDFLLHRHWLEAYRAAVDFFERKLRNRPAPDGRLK